MSDLKYLQFTDHHKLSSYLDELYALFDLCFGVAPYFEDMEFKTVYDTFEKICTEGVLFFCFDDEKLVGFCGAIPLSRQKDVYDIVKEHISPDISEYWYHSEIGSHPEYRRRRIATTLLQNVLATAPSKRVVMRTYENNEGSIGLHKNFGFKMLTLWDGTPVTQDVFGQRKDGSISSDRRIFMTYIK